MTREELIVSLTPEWDEPGFTPRGTGNRFECAAIQTSLALADHMDAMMDALVKQNLKGHMREWIDQIDASSIFHTTGWGMLLGIDDEIHFDLYEAWKNNTPLETNVKIHKNNFSACCSDCGERLDVETNGIEMFLITDPCKHINVYTTEISVPSGKLVIANDLRNHVPPMVEDENQQYHSLETRAGLMEESLDYAKVGLGYGFAGNGDPNVYQIRKNTFIIGSDKKYKSKKKIGQLITDLWWYSIADYDLVTKSKKYKPKDQIGWFVLDVKPGIYQIKHFGHLHHSNLKAEITWLRDCADASSLESVE